MKWLYLDRLSSITSSTSYPFDLGDPTIKSIDISSYITFGMGRGCNNPTGLVALYFCLWQFHIMQPSLSHLFSFLPNKNYSPLASSCESTGMTTCWSKMTFRSHFIDPLTHCLIQPLKLQPYWYWYYAQLVAFSLLDNASATPLPPMYCTSLRIHTPLILQTNVTGWALLYAAGANSLVICGLSRPQIFCPKDRVAIVEFPTLTSSFLSHIVREHG